MAVELTIFSLLPNHEGRFTITADPNQTIQKTIKAFCSENEVNYSSNYVLRSQSQEDFDKNRKLSSYGIRSGDELYLAVRDDGKWACGCSQWWILVFVCLLIGVIGIVTISVLLSMNYEPVYSYGIGIDAGSSHTKLYVYQWQTGKSNGTGIVDEIYSCPALSEKQLPPLSAFADNASEAGKQCIKPCLDRALASVPTREHSKTPVLLGATAGMRILRISNNRSAEAIMSSVRDTIASYPFLLKNPQEQVRIIEGSEEGAFSWVATNYLSGTLGFHPMQRIVNWWTQFSSSSVRTVGALDMGGASTQITFRPEDPGAIIPKYQDTLILFGYTYNVYTYSYLCYGLNEARRRHLANLVKASNNTTIVDPCSPLGYNFTKTYSSIFQVPCTLSESEVMREINYTFLGSGETSLCADQTLLLFNRSVPCKDPPCTFDGVYQPPLYDHFLGFSGFYYTVAFLNLTQFPNFTLSDYKQAMDSYCNQTYHEVLMLPKTRYLLMYCFNAHFIYNLLVNGYGFNDSNWNSIQFDNRVDGVEIGWILGMMINTTNIIPPLDKVELIVLPIFIILLVLFVVFLLLSLAFAVHARRSRRSQYRSLPMNEENPNII